MLADLGREQVSTQDLLPLVIDPATRDPPELTLRRCGPIAGRSMKRRPGDFTMRSKQMDTHSLYQMYLALVVIGVGGFIYFLPAVIASAATQPIRVQPRNRSTSRVTDGHDK